VSFNLVRTGGTWLRDPRELPRFAVPSANVFRSYSASTQSASSTGFFSGNVAAVDRIPGSVVTNSVFATGVFKTLASYTGSGLLANIVGPNVGNPTVYTWRITVDGVAYSFSTSTYAVHDRIVLGWGLPIDAYHASTNYGFQHEADSPDGSTAALNAAAGFVLLGPQDPRIPQLLKFDTSILVELSLAGYQNQGDPGNRTAVVMTTQS